MTDGPDRRTFLAGIAATGLPLPAQAPPTQRADRILDRVQIGAEFFLNATETRRSVFSHFEKMARTGLTVARIFTLWDQIEREKGHWDFSGYDWIYEAAAQNGILIANTLCSEDPPGWMGTAPFYHAWRDLADPALRSFSEIYLEKVVSRYKNHPAHGVWLLQNEPGIRSDVEPYVVAAFGQWLKQKYGTVERLNKLWYRPLRRFEDAVPPVDSRRGWSDYPSNLDWRRFRCDHLVEQLRWIRSVVERHHPGALTHINPPGLTGNMPASGQDMWRLRPTAHFVGASMHASWHFGMFARDEFGLAYAYCCDLARSVSAPASWWVTELQAGPTIFTGQRPLNPTGGEITRWLWDGIGNGARGIVFWLWHPRTEGNEAGEWGLAGANGEPTERTRATAEVARVLRSHDDFFQQAKPLPARAAILYNQDALLLYSVDGHRRPADEVMQSLMGCYKALHHAHVPVDFLDTAGLEAGAASRYRVLYLPYCFALTEKSAEAIRQFVRGGGVIWADGLIAWKDEQGVTKQLPPGPLADVFGFVLEDLDAMWEPYSYAGEAGRAGELWRCRIPGDAKDVILRNADGRPAAVEHRFGSGRAIYHGTALTLAFLRRGDPQAAEWISAPARAASGDLPLRMLQGTPKVSFRVLQEGSRWLAVFNNWGGAASVVVSLPAGTKSARELISGRVLQFNQTANAEVTLSLDAGASALILAE
jgi:beta-galactosidase